MSGPERTPSRRPARPPGWARVTAAAAALAGTVWLASAAVGWTQDDGEAAPPAAERPVAVPPVTEQPSPQQPGTEQPDGTLRAEGAANATENAYWSESRVTVTTDEPLESLTVELRVAGGPGVTSTGGWRTLPEEDFELIVREEGRSLVFRWELRPGAHVPRGEHIFAGQYDHPPENRELADDSFLVQGANAAGPVSTGGGFAYTP